MKAVASRASPDARRGASMASASPQQPRTRSRRRRLLGNRTTNDILCKPELEQAEAAGVVALHYTLDKPPADWPHFTGFVDAPMLEKTMPPPGPDTYIFCCGPPPMIKSAIAKLEALGHDPSHVLCF